MKINPVRNNNKRNRSPEKGKISNGVNPIIFRAYDIRGIYPQEINEESVYKIGRAFVKFLEMKKLNIVVGRDNRLSSPSLFKSLIKGILDEGANVIDISLSTTPMLYFASGYFNFDGGIEITSSHNPPKYNGLKLVRERAIPIGGESGLKEIQSLAQSIEKLSKKKKGKVIKKEILSDYIEFNLKSIDLKRIKFLKIAIDTANAVPGILIPEISKKLKLKIYHLFKKLDGNFPNHLPNPIIKENLRTLQNEVKNKKADFGVAFDGDGDRILFVDEKGKIISPDLIFSLISSLILKSNPGQKILYDVCTSKIVRETIEKEGGIPVLSRVGHTFIKEKMRKENIIFAGETSAHYYLRDHYFSESPLFVFFKVLEEISRTGKPISQLVKPFQKYFHSGEINFKVKDKEKVLKEIEKRYKRGKILKIDGIRVDFKNWWFNLRPSQTEPVLRLVIEAKTKKLLREKKKELKKLIRQTG